MDAPPRPVCAFAVGEGFSRTLLFDAAAVRRLAAEIGDTNKLHHDAAFAGATRFGGLIASGGHTVAAMMGPIADWMNARGTAMGLEFAFRLRRAVRVDTSLELTWRIESITPKDSLKGYLSDMTGTLAGTDGAAVEATCRALALWPGALAR
jgi:acyl dehydratase